jgi:hypothetical protein
MDSGAKSSGPRADATQELQAADVLEVIDTRAPASVLIEEDEIQVIPRRPSGSISSIAPVALSGGAAAAPSLDLGVTRKTRLRERRRRLSRVVVGAVAACALILVAAVVARVAQSADSVQPSSAVAAATNVALASPPVAAPAPVVPAPEKPSTGMIRLARPAAPGHVWVDGQKLASPSALVGCGPHQIKVGPHGKTRSVDVPCGGEVRLTR